MVTSLMRDLISHCSFNKKLNFQIARIDVTSTRDLWRMIHKMIVRKSENCALRMQKVCELA